MVGPTVVPWRSRARGRTLEGYRFGLDEMQDAYDVFADTEAGGALKVALFRT
ncbi:MULTISPECIES: hypothetical protein [Kitasatospora]|uniref:Alcohol dehydrogenase n=2 Tax=Kitasatospora TaxID=2063 RepID=A0ABT1J7H9_9ACTN|nr:hypothetical protein [Kitasatospora paracochleata]MCP2313385.1 hypothetical protein [Kitasatospora paracochleata]